MRYYGLYSNKTRSQQSPIPDRIIRLPEPEPPPRQAPPAQILLIPAPPKQAARDMRPLWRDLIIQVWGGDPLQCPCCKGNMKPVRKVIRCEEVQFFLLLNGLWEGIIQLPRPPPPPWQAIKEWIADAPLWPCRLQDPPPDLVIHDAPPGCGGSIPDDEPDLDWFNRPRNPSNPDPNGLDQRPTWRPEEIPLDDERILVLEST